MFSRLEVFLLSDNNLKTNTFSEHFLKLWFKNAALIDLAETLKIKSILCIFAISSNTVLGSRVISEGAGRLHIIIPGKICDLGKCSENTNLRLFIFKNNG